MTAEESEGIELRGRVVVITGACGGIGSATALEFAKAGARLALLDRNLEACEALQREVEALGTSAIGLACDVSDLRSVEAAAMRSEEALGPCEVLVNNAAMLYADAVMSISIERWNQLMAVNLTGYLLCAQVFGRQMIEQRMGNIVNVSSISGTLPQPNSGAYSVSKSGVNMLSKLLAVELGEYGIRSNVVSPALVRTPLSEAFYRDPEILARRTQIVPVRRIGAPDDIAQAILFLASNRASYISGQEITVDGGLGSTWLGTIPRPGFDKKVT